MSKSILKQLDIDITKLINSHKRATNIHSPMFVAKLSNTSTANSNKAALLQINIADENNATEKLAASLELISQEFAAVTLFIDSNLALLAYRIILPYMSIAQIQDIVIRRKLDWIAENMPMIKSLSIPWAIVADTQAELQSDIESNICEISTLRNNSKAFDSSIQKDIKDLKSYLSKIHNISSCQYKKDLDISNYIITRMAAIQAMYHFNHYEYVYTALNHMHSYQMIPNTLPKNDTISLLKVTHNKKQLLTSSELYKDLTQSEFLTKISIRRSYLNSYINNFNGHIYLQAISSKILSCNKNQALSLGLSDESYLQGRSTLDLFPKNDSDSIAKTMQTITSKNEPLVLIENFPYRGERNPFLSIKMPLKNHKNKIIGLIGFSVKMENIKESVEFIEERCENIMHSIISEGKKIKGSTSSYITTLMQVLADMPGYIFWQDLSDKILGCNHNYATLLGYDAPSSITGKHHRSFLTDAESSINSIIEIVKTGISISSKETYKAASKNIDMISYKSPVKDDQGNIIGIMVVALEASENKINTAQIESEQLAVSDHLTSNLIQAIEQDLHNPFTQFFNITQMCAKEETDIEKRDTLNAISNCAKDLLIFRKKITSANRQNIISIKDLTNSVISKFISDIQQKKLAFEVCYDKKIPAKVIGNKHQLKDTIYEILDNAISHSKQKHMTLVVKLEQNDKSECLLSFSVLESKNSISKEEQLYIFKKFNMVECVKSQLA